VTKFSVFVVAWILVLGVGVGGLYGYDWFTRWRAEEARIDQWVEKTAKSPKGDEQVANFEVLLKGYCGITYRQLDKAIAKYELLRGASYVRAKEKLREELVSNPFTTVVLKQSCPFFQQQVDEIRQNFEARLARGEIQAQPLPAAAPQQQPQPKKTDRFAAAPQPVRGNDLLVDLPKWAGKDISMTNVGVFGVSNDGGLVSAAGATFTFGIRNIDKESFRRLLKDCHGITNPACKGSLTAMPTGEKSGAGHPILINVRVTQWATP